MGELITLLRLIGPILNNWLVKMCEEIAEHAIGQRCGMTYAQITYSTEVKGPV